MEQPQSPPNSGNVGEWERYGLAYLSEHFKEAAPKKLSKPMLFERSPLEGEGATVVFEFSADRSGRGAERHFVVVGQTEPNYYPAYDLSGEEAFDLHLGTRFMLVMGVGQVDGADDEYDATADARGIVDRISPKAAIEDVALAATFEVGGQLHAVIRCKLSGQPVYIMGRDAPPGFSRRTDLPPQAAYRMHIGQVLRREPAPKSDSE